MVTCLHLRPIFLLNSIKYAAQPNFIELHQFDFASTLLLQKAVYLYNPTS